MFNLFPVPLYKFFSFLMPLILFFSGSSYASLDYSDKLGNQDYTGLCEAYEDYFKIGAAVYSYELDDPRLVDFILKNFNSITPEWELKQSSLNPEEGVWNFDPMDKLADFARENNLQLRGHTLIWPVQDVWMLWTDETRATPVSKEVLFERMDEYIGVVMGRYGDVIHIWDVVNEPFHYDRWMRLKEDTDYFKIAGEEFVTKAFEFAAKYADEDDILMVNETFVEGNAAKTDNMFYCVKKWLKQGVRIDGIGTQGHMGTISTVPTDVNFKVIDKLVKRCKALGVKLEYTEVDMKIYENEAQRTAELPEWLEVWQINKYQKFFEALRRNKDTVIGATFWGLDDAHTVINYGAAADSPRDWPMLFDDNSIPKQNFYAVCDF
ncbi:MAG: endo-1,4-beta-xylanase [Oscillospiraceae bacterium]|nr:endo-1,4-beta-xylanase [Oscillospiraceae bacterium]